MEFLAMTGDRAAQTVAIADLQALDLAERAGTAKTAAVAAAYLAFVHGARQDFDGAQPMLDRGLVWAARLEEPVVRAEAECQLLSYGSRLQLRRGDFSSTRR